MRDIKNEDIVDLFSQELSKKQQKEDKKIARIRSKEKKKKIKKEKELEKIEDIEFAKKIQEKEIDVDFLSSTNSSFEKLDFLIQNEDNENNEVMSRTKINENVVVEKKKHIFLNLILGLFIIILFLVSIDYLIFNVLKQKELKMIITSSLLCSLAIFYILSIIIRKEGVKKLFQILATISIAGFMCYQLFII